MKNIFINVRRSIYLIAGLLIFHQGYSQTETLATGSFIINMGATNPNTIGNGLKPYGMIYDLIREYNVPIKWVISQTKSKDGADFTYNGIQYAGGTFIVPGDFRTAAVNSRITYWIGQGVVGTTTISPLTVDVTRTLVAVPRWTLDAAYGFLAEAYLANAGINLIAFPGAFNWKTPATLDCCDDFFVLTHADPQWSTHGRLWSWNKDCLGSIWGGCHAVSKLENMTNPSDATQRANFLSTNGLLLYTLHTGGSAPYTHINPSDQIAQYMGATDLTHTGSESIYMPNPGSAWRPGTKTIVYDPTQANVPSSSPGVAANIIYGRGMDDPNRGYVMYEGGHSLNRGTSNDVAAQRVFLNFSFFQVQPKAPQITVTGVASGARIPTGATVTGFNASATSPLSGITFTYNWSSSCGGSFSNPTGASTNFTAPLVGPTTTCVISCEVSDNCGRVSSKSFSVTIVGAAPPIVTNDSRTLDPGCGAATVTLNVLANDVEPDGQPMTLTSVTGVANGTVSFTALGNITYTSNAGFVGNELLTYTVCDNSTPIPGCATGTLAITVGIAGNIPNAANDAYVIKEDTIGRFDVLANDVPLVFGPLTVSAITAGPSNGKVSINIDNTITYIPNVDFAGVDNFTYRFVNTVGYSKTATVTVTVTNDACDAGTWQATTGLYNSQSPTTLTTDTYLNEANTGTNYNTTTTMITDSRPTSRARPVLNFDLTTVPAAAIVENVNLRMTLVSSSVATNYGVSVYKITNPNTITQETWLNRITGTAWTAAGGDFQTNTDSILVSNAAGGTGGTANYNWAKPSLTTMVQNWVNTAVTNYGMLVKYTTRELANVNTTNNKTFHSNNSTTATARPLLTFNWYTCGPLPTRAPMALPDTATTVNNVSVNITTATNDYFPVAGAKTYSIITSPASGSASINATTGVVTYTPSGAFNGVRSLTYRVLDNTSTLADTATVYINVTNAQNDAINDAPASALSAVTQTINVKTNDTDPEGLVATSTVTIATAPKNGTATVDVSGNVLYTPNTGFTGNDTLFYSLCEPTPTCGTGFCDTARVAIVVTNRAPTAVNDSKTILPCSPNTFNIISNDTDPEGNTLTIASISALSNPAAGALSNNGDGTITFAPATSPGFTGLVTFTYTVTDNGVTPLSSAAATVSITVTNPINTAPIAGNDVESTNVDQQLVYNLMDNDSDPEYNELTNPQIITAPLHGTASINAINGLITYVPNPGFFGTDVLTYRIWDRVSNPATNCTYANALSATATFTITVVVPNTTNAVNDENSTWINTVLNGSVMYNDLDPENNNPLVFNGFIIGGISYTSGAFPIPGINSAGTPIANAGSIAINPTGTYTFNPSTGFTGLVTLPYSINDSYPNAATDTAKLIITVNPYRQVSNSVIVNNVETITYGTGIANNALVNSNDPQGNLFTVTSFSYDANGDGILETTAVPGTSVVVGGITIGSTMISNAGAFNMYADGTYVFLPFGDFHGSVDFTFTVCDNGTPVACATALLHIDVLPDLNGPIKDPPVAGDDFGFGYINTALNGSFINNDFSPNGNVLSLFGTNIVTAGPHTPIASPVATDKGGTVQYYADGTYLYTPPVNYFGPDFVIYTISDITGGTPVTRSAEIHFLLDPGISISGKVWDDANGNVAINGTESGTNVSGTLWVNLINSIGNVIAIRAVNADGTYVINNVKPADNFSIILSTTAGTIGSPAPTASLPFNWANTGESRNGTTDLGLSGVIDTRLYGYLNTINYDFGIDQLPNSTPWVAYVSPSPILGQTFTLNGGVNPAIPIGDDPEDGALGANKRIVITSIPSNSLLLYNGIAVTNGQVITSFNPSLLQLRITSSTIGSISTSFNFAYVDAALKQDPTPASYLLTWEVILPIKLESFTATLLSDQVQLKWLVSEEIDVASYEIEHSTNAINFVSIGSTQAKNSRNYDMLHQQPVAGPNYYRLKIIDKDGKISYSQVRIINVNKSENLLVYPNPAHNYVNIVFKGSAINKSAAISLIAMDGKTVAYRKVAQASHTETLDVSGLSSGKYFLRIVNELNVTVKSIELIK